MRTTLHKSEGNDVMKDEMKIKQYSITETTESDEAMLYFVFVSFYRRANFSMRSHESNNPRRLLILI